MKPVVIVTLAALFLAAPGPSKDRPRDTAVRPCQACGQVIVGPYFETGGVFYHPDHFKCRHCGEPIRESYSVYKGKNYHTTCFENEVALRCEVCAEIIRGQYLLDHWGNAYHTYHENDVQVCDFCNRFIVGELADGMIHYRDGRRLCGECAPTAITSQRRARLLMQRVAIDLRRYGIEVNAGTVELRLVEQKQLSNLAPGRAHNTTGFTDYVVKKNLFGRTTSESIRIYLLKGMPETQMKGTLAHELTHVWQFVRGRLNHDPAFAEGSCNYAAYLVLRQDGSEGAQFIIKNMMMDRDPVYGNGFRMVKHYVERQGLGAWLEQLARKRPKLVVN